jgi:two-component system chemotaxis sensor kinase CheA
MVDELLGQQQVVIKSLGQGMAKVAGVSGGAILGDGRVGLILDATGLLQLAEGRAMAAEPEEAYV